MLNFSDITSHFLSSNVLVIVPLQAAFHNFILYVVFDRLHHRTSFFSPVIKRTDTFTNLFYILQLYYLKVTTCSLKLPPQNPKICSPFAPGSTFIGPQWRKCRKKFRKTRSTSPNVEMRKDTQTVWSQNIALFPFEGNSGPSSDRT